MTSDQATGRTASTAPMIRPAIKLGLVRADLEGQNAAVVQTCVPTVALKGDSYRLKDRDLARAPAEN
jgi:hypothetical protein